VEAEKCWEVKYPVQGRWKQKGRWVDEPREGRLLGAFFYPQVFAFVVIRAISIATEEAS